MNAAETQIAHTPVLTKRRSQILQLLSDGRWHTLAEIKTSFNFMQFMYFDKLVDGSALPDRRGYGNTPETSLWRITVEGRAAIAKAEGTA